LLLRPDGTEVTRLPAEVDGERYMQALAQAMTGKPVKALLAQAQAGKPLGVAEWQPLAFHAWDVDESVVVAADKRAATQWDLAQRANATAPEASARLALQAMRTAAGDKAAPPFDNGDQIGVERIVIILAGAGQPGFPSDQFGEPPGTAAARNRRSVLLQRDGPATEDAAHPGRIGIRAISAGERNAGFYQIDVTIVEKAQLVQLHQSRSRPIATRWTGNAQSRTSTASIRVVVQPVPKRGANTRDAASIHRKAEGCSANIALSRVARAFTSTNTKVSPLRATISISPPRVRPRRAMMR
jgi:hypothetical protein